MKKSVFVRLKTALFLLLFLLSTAVQAQTENTLLWKISGKDLKSPSYLFGTIHIICEDDAPMTEAMKEAFAATEQLVLEIDMTDPTQMTQAQTLMMAPEGIDYKGELSEEAYNKLDELMTNMLGMGMQVGRMMKPVAIMGIAYQGLVSCENASGMEELFMEMTQGTEMTMGGLETVALQMGIFDDIPMDEQISWIEDLVGDPQKGKDEFAQMMATYKSQDLEALYGQFREAPEYIKYEKELLIDRNANWIPKMEKMMKEKPAFFAVGAMHLGSEYGVIKLLRDAGYTVEGVENK